jgi:hypothetical protein
MGYVPSTMSQRLTEVILGGKPHIDRLDAGTGTRARRLPHWDPYECSAADRASIKSALETMSLVYAPVFYQWPGAGKELANRLAGLSEESISIGCDGCTAPTLTWSARQRPNAVGRLKYEMDICADVIKPADAASRSQFIHGVVFFAAITLAGGTALDYLSLFQLAVVNDFGRNSTQGGPSQVWRRLMCAESSPLPTPTLGYYRAGTFMVWSPADGHLYIGDKVNPTTGALQVNQNSYLLDWRISC